MKKTLIFAAAALISASAFAQTVTSANIVGYTKVSKPGNGEFHIAGVPFSASEWTNLVDKFSFSGSTDWSLADQIIVFTASNQTYATYALYDIAGYPEYTAWRSIEEFTYNGPEWNPTLEPGTAFWFKGSGSTVDTNVIMTGEAVLAANATNNIVTGYQLLANPFSDSVAISNLSLEASATYNTDWSLADQIVIFDTETQGYSTYALYGITGYPEYTAWRSIDDFTYNGAEIDVVLDPGQGFWYKAQADFTWVETNKYLDNL